MRLRNALRSGGDLHQWKTFSSPATFVVLVEDEDVWMHLIAAQLSSMWHHVTSTPLIDDAVTRIARRRNTSLLYEHTLSPSCCLMLVRSLIGRLFFYLHRQTLPTLRANLKEI